MNGQSSLYQLLAELDGIPGVSGYEERVAAYIKAQLNGITDEHYADPLGNQIFIKRGRNPDLKLMLSAHMDEIGFIVHYIDEQGFVFFVPAGGHDDRMLMNQVLTIHTDKGPVHGVTGSKPAHIVTPEEAKKSIPMANIHLDLGTSSRAETESLGVRIGDFITFERKGQLLNNTRVFTGKAVDDRSGCAVMIEVMKRLRDKQPEATVYAVASVQEEVGIRGSGPAAFGIQPDVALAIDVTLAGGSPGIEPKEMPIQFGQGPAIKFYDWSLDTYHGNAVPRRLTRKLVEVAEKANIPYQREVLLHGATDGWGISVSGTGVITGCISIPSRYIHSAIGCVHLDDMEGAVQLIVSFIEELTEKL
ncbi:M42 family metallopeptidase [Brevibacillus agri]|uniref:M42 family metallopeptidase n=1 Tax=Brevibacillus agri TaxID=51101 RepID=UPI003D1EB016